MVKPKACMTAKVPTTDTGTASSGMIEARQVCRNRMTTMTTRMMASISVWMTESIDSWTYSVVS